MNKLMELYAILEIEIENYKNLLDLIFENEHDTMIQIINVKIDTLNEVLDMIKKMSE